MKLVNKRPVTVEDLLRLKRVERPGAEFWTQFDRELRAKQLAALVEKRPWWRDLARAFSGISRYRLPLGATAIIAVTFLAVRDSEPNTAPAIVSLAPEGVAFGIAATVPSTSEAETVTTASTIPEATSTLAQVEAPALDATDSVPRPEAVASGGVSRHVSLLGGSFHAATTATDLSASIRYHDAKFAGTSASEAMIARNLLGAVRGFETRVLPARPAVEPLQQMMTPRDARRTKMLTAMVSNFNETPAPTGERVARYLPDDRLYDQIHRFSGRGDRLSVRF